MLYDESVSSWLLIGIVSFGNRFYSNKQQQQQESQQQKINQQRKQDNW